MSIPELTREGNYEGEVVDMEFWKSPNTGTDCIGIAFKIGDEVLYYNGYFTEKAAKYALQAMRYCGWKSDDMAKAPEECQGNLVPVTVRHDTHDGRTKAIVKFVNNPKGRDRSENAIKGDALTALQAKLAGKIASIQADKPSDEEVPFNV